MTDQDDAAQPGGDGEGAAATEVSSIAQRLERLFEVQRPPHEPHRRWRNSEVVAACRREGRELSESHLSELRRGIKVNPTVRVLDALAWFFEVRASYFTDADVAREIEADLAERERALQERLEADLAAEAELADASRALQQMLRKTGATSAAHRGFDRGQSRERASMMRALARALSNETGEDDSETGGRGPDDRR